MGKQKRARLRGHIILCVDDEQPVLDAIRRALRGEPYALITTTDALEAIGWIETREVDLIILDQNMPTPGTELLKAVREFSPDVACLVLTGFPDRRVLAGRLSGWVQKLITKPWNDRELREAVRSLIFETDDRHEQEFADGLRTLIDTTSLRDTVALRFKLANRFPDARSP